MTSYASGSSQHVTIGLMSGTSLDGVDGVLAVFPDATDAKQPGRPVQMLASAYVPFSAALREQALALQQSGENEIHEEALFANAVAGVYAACVRELMQQRPNIKVSAIGAHGQTIRHRPELGYTRQSLNAALLAELTGTDVIADFRSRDIATGGQGAPLVPAFHRAIFGATGECRVVVNIGGISNISVLHADGETTGFDTGPGNVLMDAWIAEHQGTPYDKNGDWAAQGHVDAALLRMLCAEPFLKLSPPKSTGRDLFNRAWLEQQFSQMSQANSLGPVDVQATLTAFTAITLADAISSHAAHASSVFVCGGGAYNVCLMQQLGQALSERHCKASLQTTEVLGVSPNHVEALAFAWLAQRFVTRQPGNLPQVTGAQGLRVLGALYPA